MTTPAKKARRVRHSSLYFADGDIALSLEDEDDDGCILHIYRVDKRFLSRHSSVFAGMFSLPSTPGTNEEYEGVTLVTLTGDNPDAMEDILKFMYNPASLLFEDRDPDTPFRATNILTLAQKYDIPAVKPFIARQLESDWPTTLEKWIRRQGEIKELNAMRGVATTSISEPRPVFPEPASAIRLAVDFFIPSILPAAFYELSQITLEDNWDRIKYGKWKFRDLGRAYAWPSRDGKMARWRMLDSDLLMRALLGRTALYEAEQSLPKAYKIDGCPQEDEECEDEIDALLKAAKSAARHVSRMAPDPLRRVKEMLHGLPNDKLCEECEACVQQRLDVAMKKIWDDLPRSFSLDK